MLVNQTKIISGKLHSGKRIRVYFRMPLKNSHKQENVTGEIYQAKVKREAFNLHLPIQKINSIFLRQHDLSTWLFMAAVVVYLSTRLLGLTKFPIYFFTDEAIQTVSIATLVENNYRLYDFFLPTYFSNGDYFNLGLSVYLQWLPYIFFGKSAFITRAISVFVTLLAVFSVSIILRNIFKLNYWWLGILFLSITPAWFLHSRTAFETTVFVSFYAGGLCAYLLYLYNSPRYLYLTLFFLACAFYTYSPAQFIIPLTVIVLLFSDLHYHIINRRIVFLGLGLLIIFGIPFMRFIFYNPHVPFAHLNTLGSYWIQNATFTEKFMNYLSEYAIGMSPWYWYIPNLRDFSRHLMKDYGHIMIWSLPFALIGITSSLYQIRQSAHRTLLIFMLVSPAAAALVGIGITRTLAFVIPICIFTAIGFERVTGWIQSPYTRLKELSVGGSSTNWLRLTTGLLIFLVGLFFALKIKDTTNRIALLSMIILLSTQISSISKRISYWLISFKTLRFMQSWYIKPKVIALTIFAGLTSINFWMLTDALRNGPTWFTDYGLGGMQYGAFQIFDMVEEYKQEHPDTTIILSPDWANGANALLYFFLNDPSSIQLGSIRGHINQKLPLDDSILFVITPQEYQKVFENPKFTDLQVEKIVPYPDGNPGFYFVRLRYSDNVDEVFAAEEIARHILQESELMINGEEVKIKHSILDSPIPTQSIALLFDGDPLTMAKTQEANPFVIELTYPTQHTINEFSIVIGSTNVIITLTGYAFEGAEPITYSFRGRGTIISPKLTFKLPEPLIAQIVRIEHLDVYTSEPTQNHIWEITFR
ncbi:MAG TPA: hypothetical protein DHW49_03795 [Anaerolineae bacterium]|nr:hypothetical protein [Anaerolineae bacterium]